MNERVYSERGSEPDRYINRVSATVVVLFKVLDGLVAGFFLYHLLRIMGLLLTAMMNGALDINYALQLLFSEYGIPPQTANGLTGLTIGGVALPVVIWAGIFLVIIAGLLLVVIEALALLTLRFTKRGAVFVRVIHQIYMGICIVYILLLGISCYRVFTLDTATDSTVRAMTQAWSYSFIIWGILALIIILLNLCYHKDIAMAMGTVAYEIETGRQGKLKKTHLSGISFLFSLPYALNAIAILFAIIGMRDGSLHLQEGYNLSIGQAVLLILIPVILMIKHLSVCFCNRNLKRAR